jgi:hypothetical protein
LTSVRKLLLLAPLALALAACGGGGKSTSESGNPLVDAADSTAQATSEKTSVTGKVFLPGQTLTLRGDGGYDHSTDEGWQHIAVSTPGDGVSAIDEIFVKGVLWMKSSLFAEALPAGKQWVKVDINKAGKNLGFNFKALMGQTPADVLKQMQRTRTPVTTVGTEEIGGVETTHYRAAIDTTKIPAADTFQKLTTAKYKPIDVWVDDDSHIRQARFDYTAKIDPAMAPRARVVLTMKLIDFGTTVDVEPPKASLVVDVSDPVGSGG